MNFPAITFLLLFCCAPAYAGCAGAGTRSGITVRMALSARNQLPGTVEEVRLGDVMAHVVVKVGEHSIESLISRRSADEMSLRKGDSVQVVVKSTEVMIRKD